MELDIFISKTLEDIIKGVNNAQNFAKENGTTINPSYMGFATVTTKTENIEFDIAITVTNEQNSNIGGKIGIASFGIGSNVSDKGVNESVSRVKFSIPVIFRPSMPKS